MKLRASANKRSFGHHRPGASGTVHFVRIEQRLARFAGDDMAMKKTALADGARIAAAAKSASDARGIHAEKSAEKSLALNAWEDEGGAVRRAESRIDGAVKLACSS